MSKDINLHINNFDGPLDLLLSLVKEKEVDIFEINLLELATSYLEIIDTLKDTDMDLAGDYLVMAATLLQLKARMLLEDPSEKEEVEKQRDDILRQLAEYEQFKKISKELRIKEELRKKMFIKPQSDTSSFQPAEDESKLDGKSDAIKLIISLRKMFERTNAKKLKEASIEKFNLSPAERRQEIVHMLKINENPSFEDIFSVPTLNHFAVTLVTVLDMARKQEIKMTQDTQYGIITFQRGVIDE